MWCKIGRCLEKIGSIKRNTSLLQTGTLRFCGTTEFASGQWVGIELDNAEGKNDGSVGGIRYFICSPKQGVFSSFLYYKRHL